MSRNHKSKQHPEDKKNLFEWIIFALSVLLITVILGYLIYQTLNYEPGSPDLVISYEKDPSPNAPFRYHLMIKNEGQETAEEVQIEFVLEKNGEEMELATINIPFAPKASQREGWIIFSKNPADADTLYARVVSYKRP